MEDNFKIYLPWFGVGIATVIVLFLVIKYVPLDPTKEEVVHFAEEEIIEAPEFLSTGELEHLCDGGGNCDYSGTVYNGGLRFEVFNEFTLNSVDSIFKLVLIIDSKSSLLELSAR